MPANEDNPADQEARYSLEIRSSFPNGGTIPGRHTRGGGNVSPPLIVVRAPDGTRTLAVIMDDQDAPGGPLAQWVLYNYPVMGNSAEIPENLPRSNSLRNGAQYGATDLGGGNASGYEGPDPSSGVHRYRFKVYALDAGLSLGGGATAQQLIDAMRGHVLGAGRIVGMNSR